MSSAPLPHIIFDLSRLMWRATRQSPTGIDRVELAYARHLIAAAPERLSFTGWWHRFALLPKAKAMDLVRILDEIWSGAGPASQDDAIALAGKLRRHAMLVGELPLYFHVSRLGQPMVYLHVSHYRLHRPRPLRRFKRRTDARMVFFVHDLIPISHAEHVAQGDDQEHVERMDAVAALADQVVVNTEGTAAALRRHFAEDGFSVPIAAVPLGIDLRAPARTAPQAATPYFICIATIESRKNHMLLLKVWERLAATLGDKTPRLVLAGRRGWKHEPVIETIAASPVLRTLVEEHSGISDAAMAGLLAGARALLYPTFAEGFGLPVVEAMTLGVPVLCSDLPELREVGGTVPEFLDPHDPELWLRTILNYAQPHSPAAEAQCWRRQGWRPPSWEAHFAAVQPLIDGLQR